MGSERWPVGEPRFGVCQGRGYAEEVKSEHGATVLDREPSPGREDQGEGRGKMGQREVQWGRSPTECQAQET